MTRGIALCAVMMATGTVAEAQRYFARERIVGMTAGPKALACDQFVFGKVVDKGSATGLGFVQNASGWESAALAKCVASGAGLSQCHVSAAGSGKTLWSVWAYRNGVTIAATSSNVGGGLTPNDVAVAECGLR